MGVFSRKYNCIIADIGSLLLTNYRRSPQAPFWEPRCVLCAGLLESGFVPKDELQNTVQQPRIFDSDFINAAASQDTPTWKSLPEARRCVRRDQSADVVKFLFLVSQCLYAVARHLYVVMSSNDSYEVSASVPSGGT